MKDLQFKLNVEQWMGRPQEITLQHFIRDVKTNKKNTFCLFTYILFDDHSHSVQCWKRTVSLERKQKKIKMRRVRCDIIKSFFFFLFKPKNFLLSFTLCNKITKNVNRIPRTLKNLKQFFFKFINCVSFDINKKNGLKYCFYWIGPKPLDK